MKSWKHDNARTVWLGFYLSREGWYVSEQEGGKKYNAPLH